MCCTGTGYARTAPPPPLTRLRLDGILLCEADGRCRDRGAEHQKGNCVLHVKRMGCFSRIIALRMTRSCRATAMTIVFGALAAAFIRSRNAASWGMRRMAVSAAM